MINTFLSFLFSFVSLSGCTHANRECYLLSFSSTLVRNLFSSLAHHLRSSLSTPFWTSSFRSLRRRCDPPLKARLFPKRRGRLKQCPLVFLESCGSSELLLPTPSLHFSQVAFIRPLNTCFTPSPSDRSPPKNLHLSTFLVISIGNFSRAEPCIEPEAVYFAFHTFIVGHYRYWSPCGHKQELAFLIEMWTDDWLNLCSAVLQTIPALQLLFVFVYRHRYLFSKFVRYFRFLLLLQLQSGNYLPDSALQRIRLAFSSKEITKG